MYGDEAGGGREEMSSEKKRIDIEETGGRYP